MPRVSRAQADLNRLAITEAAARLFRERGVNAVSVTEATAAAGLTHGGFYGQFASKEALAGEACRSAFAASAGRWRSRISQHVDAEAARQAIIDGYLSTASRNAPGTACATATLAADAARSSVEAPLREAFAAGVAELLVILATVQPKPARGGERADALADLSTMVGAMVLARATAGRGLSDEFLASARKRLTASGKRRVC